MKQKKFIGFVSFLALAVSMLAVYPAVSMAEDETPWQDLEFSSAVSQKVYDNTGSGGMIEKQWDVGEDAVLNGIRPANGGGELSQKDAQIIFKNDSGIGQFKMTYVSTLDLPGENYFVFQMSVDGTNYDTITMDASVFVKNGFHSNPALSTYVEQRAFISQNVASKGYKYLKVVRKGTADTAWFPLITEMFFGNGSGAFSSVDLNSGTQMVCSDMKEQAWVVGDAGTLNGMRPDNDGVLNLQNAEVIFNTEKAIGHFKMSFVSTTDIDNTGAFQIEMSVDGIAYDKITMNDPTVVNDNVKFDGYVKQYEIVSNDVLLSNYKYVKIVRQGSSATQWYPAINTVSVQTPEVQDVVTYEPLTAENGETIYTDQLDSKDNADMLGKMNNVSGLAFDTSVYKNREYLGLNYSSAHMKEGLTEGYAIYRADGMQRFEYTYISNEAATAPTLKAYVSKDGITFTEAEVTSAADATRTGDYKRYNVVSTENVPAGTNYLKLEFTNSGAADNYQTALTMVSIAYKPDTVQLVAGTDQAMLIDDFEPPFAQSYAKENMTNHPGTSGKLKVGQLYMRQEITGPSYIIYKTDQMLAFEVDSDLDPTADLGDDFTIQFYTSKTGEDDTWVPVDNVAKRLGTTAGNNDWLDYLYSSNSLPADSSYLKIEIPELENNNYDVNLCSVKILYSTKSADHTSDTPADNNTSVDTDTNTDNGQNSTSTAKNSASPNTGRAELPIALMILGAAAGCTAAVTSKKSSRH